MNLRFVSILVVFLLITSVSIPAVNAEPAFAPGLAAAPVVAEAAEKMIIAGITVLVTTAAVIKIGKEVGIRWDGEKKNWENFKTDITERIGKLIHSKQWIEIHSEGGRALMTAIYYNDAGAAGAAGGGKDDKLFFEARIHNRRIEIKSEALNEEQALKEMGRGKHIMTVNEKLAKNLIRKFNNEPSNADVMIEKHPRGKYGKEEFFRHGNFEAKNQRCHVWVWEP